MSAHLAVIGISAVIELIKFVQTSNNLKGKAPEEVMEMWAATRLDVRHAVDAWRTSQRP